ncbi:DUF368 domain-containing protein [Candidatus Laterigemmans baculatus]|uniref:DUF368 domain-containing protein n=1 Tax=Candidatus Laterigemmans baculatus TaxID=2770505 RepID=UPI0013D9B2EE|nr:DUF368 domain-containing protein [Candidatus Laterigemmans baculatus]
MPSAPQPASLAHDLQNVARGFCMGAADIVPGVSGGTVALVLGHYQRLVTAISQIDATALALLRERRLVAAWQHIDGRFLLALGVGVLAGIGGLANLMHWLLEHHTAETRAVFFGLVAASGIVVTAYVRRWSAPAVAACLLAAAGAYGLGEFTPTAAEPTLLYLFVCAVIAICAMILPGISGAFLMLLLGVYHPVTGLVKDFFRLQITADGLLRLVVFASGCLIGLALFSRLLRILLLRYSNTTFAALLGLMLGSLRKLWPLQVPTAETAGLPFKEQEWMGVGVADWSEPLWPLVAIALAAGAVVVAANHLASRRQAAALHTSAAEERTANPHG